MLLVEALKDALQRAIIQPHGMRLGREHLNTDWSHVRAVCQFPVGTNLFDWFLNARTGLSRTLSRSLQVRLKTQQSHRGQVADRSSSSTSKYFRRTGDRAGI